ncbi:hypothetical protein AAFF_G00095240 [Aldrovandia affinis]|uniref:Uncharacterized protein n=1 Tax=Aldrovandia affinis TaxID=143900 RepID=A0AAD7WBR6_9TELE|nr:hypothetical protein AAFF_G00095240 [Aldrovandia affinis]
MDGVGLSSRHAVLSVKEGGRLRVIELEVKSGDSDSDSSSDIVTALTSCQSGAGSPRALIPVPPPSTPVLTPQNDSGPITHRQGHSAAAAAATVTAHSSPASCI